MGGESTGGRAPKGEGVGAWYELGDEFSTSITAFVDVDDVDDDDDGKGDGRNGDLI